MSNNYMDKKIDNALDTIQQELKGFTRQEIEIDKLEEEKREYTKDRHLIAIEIIKDAKLIITLEDENIRLKNKIEELQQLLLEYKYTKSL